jgi:hypothetical protein
MSQETWDEDLLTLLKGPNAAQAMHYPLCSYKMLKSATRIVRFVARLYYPLHEIALSELLEQLHVLTFSEAFVYRMDFSVEAAQNNGSEWPLDASHDALILFLRELGIADEITAQHVGRIREFAQIETEMVLRRDITMLRRVLERRSCDIRLLHLLSLHLSKRKYDAALFEALVPFEVLAEIEDDLQHYEQDASAGHFNTMLVLERTYGDGAAKQLSDILAHYDGVWEARRNALPEPLRTRCSNLDSAFHAGFPRLMAFPGFRRPVDEGIHTAKSA